ncbi:site-specific integrase [Bacteroides pyogenes]|uniref:site-specific integrase n=1 Tax=Bacteroides pyogenes TaxID=310300 RepID=UPI003B430303
MEKISYKLVFNRKKKLNNQGVALVQVEAYLNKKKMYFSTRVYLKPEQWDTRRRIVKRHPNADGLNRMLYDYVAQIEKVELELWQQGQRICLHSLKHLLAIPQEARKSFLAFYKKEVENSSLRVSTQRNHLTTYNILKRYKRYISFADITFDFLTSFDHYLRSERYHINTIAKHMKHLKRYINVAINKGYMDVQRYAFRQYKIKTVEAHHTHLSPEELEQLENYFPEEKHIRLRRTKDAFLFCCYAGLRYSDFVSLKQENLVELYGDTWLIFQSVKTKVEIRIPLYLLFEGKALDILKRYQNNLNDFFRLRDNSNINKELLLLSKLAGIKKRISFHTARHTNATLLIYSGANITTVQKLLGHKSMKTTQIYADIMDITLIKDLERVTY